MVARAAYAFFVYVNSSTYSHRCFLATDVPSCDVLSDIDSDNVTPFYLVFLL